MKRLFAALFLMIVLVLLLSLREVMDLDATVDSASAYSVGGAPSVSQGTVEDAQDSREEAPSTDRMPKQAADGSGTGRNAQGAIIVLATAGILVAAVAVLWAWSSPSRQKTGADGSADGEELLSQQKEPTLQD